MYAKTRSLILRGTVALALIALLAVPAAAQSHRAALGLGGGWSQPGDITPGLASSTTLEPGWVAGLQLETWPGSGRVGFRLGGSFMERSLQEDPASRYAGLTADLSLLLRILPAGRGRWVAPYLAVGGGATGYASLEGSAPFGSVYGDDPVVRALAIAGGGFDLLPSGVIGLRVEAVDRIMLPSIGEGPEAEGLPAVHGPEITAALQIRGGSAARPVYLATAPAPRPAPVAAPVAAQPQATESRDAAADRAELDAARAESDQLRTRLGDWQRHVVSLNTRVDSLERALADARAAAASAGPMGTPVVAATPAVAATPVANPSAVRAAASERHESAAGQIFTVQVGAFVEEATARRWEERLRNRSIPVWVTPAQIRGQRVTRVRVGALPTQGEADKLARILAEDGWPVWVARVADGERIPADAVAATRSFIRSGN
ncbi:MAG: SPOR domain-containing protein [Gemmatimonadetes bacterium]|nr:SPOR domain-containing protein [Gemmatimonadota bacterium]